MHIWEVHQKVNADRLNHEFQSGRKTSAKANFHFICRWPSFKTKCVGELKTWQSYPIEVAIDNIFVDRKWHKIEKKRQISVFRRNVKIKRLKAIKVCNLIFFSSAPISACRLRLLCVDLFILHFFFGVIFTRSFCKVLHQKKRNCRHGVSHAAHRTLCGSCNACSMSM